MWAACSGVYKKSKISKKNIDKIQIVEYSRDVNSVAHRWKGRCQTVSQTPSWTLVDDKGTWTVRIRMTDERTGKVKQKARTTGLKVKDGTKRAAKKVAERIADELYEQFLSEQDALDNQRFIYFKEYVEAWLDTREMNVRPNTLKSYQDYADVHIIPKLGNYRVEEITWRILQEFADRLLKSHSRNTVKKFFIVIRGGS